MTRCRVCRREVPREWLRVERGQVVDGERITTDRDYCSVECLSREAS